MDVRNAAEVLFCHRKMSFLNKSVKWSHSSVVLSNQFAMTLSHLIQVYFQGCMWTGYICVFIQWHSIEP